MGGAAPAEADTGRPRRSEDALGRTQQPARSECCAQPPEARPAGPPGNPKAAPRQPRALRWRADGLVTGARTHFQAEAASAASLFPRGQLGAGQAPGGRCGACPRGRGGGVAGGTVVRIVSDSADGSPGRRPQPSARSVPCRPQDAFRNQGMGERRELTRGRKFWKAEQSRPDPESQPSCPRGRDAADPGSRPLVRRRAERLQHPSGDPVPGGGRVLEDVPGGPALPGRPADPGLRAEAALRRVHVHVPEPHHEPVQVTAAAPAPWPGAAWPSPRGRARALSIAGNGCLR